MQWERHKKAKKDISNIFNRYENYRIIHYSCQSFNRVENGQSAIIATIAIYCCVSDTTLSFDIQSVAERLKVNYQDIDKRIKEIETEILKDFLII